MNKEKKSQLLEVWDPLVRIFHWARVFFVAVEFVSDDEWLQIHTYSGYAILGLIVFRCLWGLIGSHYARFSSFLFGVPSAISYAKSLVSGSPTRYVGHNPAGALMIFVLLLTLSMTALTGIAALASEGAGPLADTFIATISGHLLEDIHEFLADATLILIVLHVLGVLVSSILHRENLIKSMMNGKKLSNEEGRP